LIGESFRHLRTIYLLHEPCIFMPAATAPLGILNRFRCRIRSFRFA
jgi:hypothetical protein